LEKNDSGRSSWENTIAAISTAQGVGGIGVIRVSGRDALAIGDRVFQSAGGKKLSQMKGYTAAYGRIRSNGEDIDEATLSYAEIKAVATGNPLIKEKMEIDNDVQRLKLLKASYDNQRYGLQDNFMIKYPKLIKTATEKLANVREDVKARDKELIDNPEFAITIGKATYTERVDGGTMMLEAISKCKTGETTAIGKFHGLELLVEKNFLGINYMVLRGKTEYKAELSTSPVGSMVKLENLFNGLHENIDFLEKKIEQYQNDLEASKTEYDKPFAYSKELNEKLARQCELNAQLDLENAKDVDADLSGPEEEREADDRMEAAAIVAEDKGTYSADREGRTR